MDPSRALNGYLAASFPRARGDGPSRSGRTWNRSVLPPRSRGWTPRSMSASRLRQASPALAGMDPVSSRTTTVELRFPRARGDGPDRTGRGRLPQKLPPRSRGWTQPTSWQNCASCASPALAGMDPARGVTEQPVHRFPRARGDGPARCPDNAAAALLPPRSRGWTQRATGHRRPASASPALAGMDPDDRFRDRAGTGFPRARGDGPSTHTPSASTWRLPPRSRGWTRSMTLRTSCPTASPALAGMDLPPIMIPNACDSFPRARGDGPASPSSSSYKTRLPPRSRGWTFFQRASFGRNIASPALAGMDRLRLRPANSATGFPRARGDGPHDWDQIRGHHVLPLRSRGWTLPAVFVARPFDASPALAVMDPHQRRRDAGRPRFPRARGDGPVVPHRQDLVRELPPRSRGWTLLNPPDRRPRLASPALAGMDLTNGRTGRRFMCFPRARGDGPPCPSG